MEQELPNETTRAPVLIDLALQGGGSHGGILFPYDLNPLGLNPLRAILAESIDFDCLKQAPMKLFVTATNVRTGRGRIFRNGEITPNVLLASACCHYFQRSRRQPARRVALAERGRQPSGGTIPKSRWQGSRACAAARPAPRNSAARTRCSTPSSGARVSRALISASHLSRFHQWRAPGMQR